MDPADGLLRAGEPGVQLTWMDAKVGDWVVTPRIGKPVEIQALWYNALRTIAGWLADRGDSRAAAYARAGGAARASFLSRFWRPELGYLADVVDGPNGDELQLRPNQVFALSLPYPLVDGADGGACPRPPSAAHCSRRMACARFAPTIPRTAATTAAMPAAAMAGTTRVQSGPG